MDYSRQLLGKSLRDLTYQDIADYFAEPQKENDLLEFKSWSEKTDEHDVWKKICVSITAFLNSSGGILIWGAPKGAPPEGGSKKELVFQGRLTGLDPRLEKDKVVSTISSRIIPLASSFRIEILEDGNGGRVAVIEMDESPYKPHQYEHVYYMRLDGQSRPAPHHYVEALFKRVAVPNLEGYLGFKTSCHLAQGVYRFVISVKIQIFNFSSAQNEEDIYFKLSNTSASSTMQNWNRASGPRVVSGEQGRVVAQDDLAPILVNGNPVKTELSFEILKSDLPNSDEPVIFMLSFGGKKSPPKFSKYILSFRPYHYPSTKVLEVVTRMENILVADEAETGGMSRDAQLFHLLER